MPLPLRLAVAFVHPQVILHVNLPEEMPHIFNILSRKLIWSFEKAEYFNFIFAKYGANAIFAAIQKNGEYSDDVYFHLKVISDPSIVINSLMFMHKMPTGLSDKERVAWWSFFTLRGEPVSAADGRLRFFGIPWVNN